jgi:succinate-semialdehyde dehydrogenase/glutarate-semialdehyde dehydrogenase
LTASVWTRDIRRGKRVAERIEAGTVMVNEVLYTHGIAQTGILLYSASVTINT